MRPIDVPFVNLQAQYQAIREEVLEAFDRVSKTGIYVLGPELEEFEYAISSYLGSRYSVGVGSGSDALFLSLLALEIGEGDEVITAPNSFVASASAINATGAKIVFADVQEDYNIDPQKVSAAITSKTKAIMPVHLTGKVADMESISTLALENNLHVVEDAAQAIGAKRRGKHAGTFGDIGCFSLHPLKNLHLHGDGGILVSDNESIIDRVRLLRNHGLEDRDHATLWGYNSRLDEVQAAIGRVKLKYLDTWNKRYRDIAQHYSVALGSMNVAPNHYEFEQPIYHRYVITHSHRDLLKAKLMKRRIHTAINYPIPLHMQRAASKLGYKKGDFPVAEKLSDNILCIPIYPELTDFQVEYVAENVCRSIKEIESNM